MEKKGLTNYEQIKETIVQLTSSQTCLRSLQPQDVLKEVEKAVPLADLHSRTLKCSCCIYFSQSRFENGYYMNVEWSAKGAKKVIRIPRIFSDQLSMSEVNRLFGRLVHTYENILYRPL